MSAITGCKEKDIPVTTAKSVDKPEYIIELHGAGGVGSVAGTKLVKGETIESSWDDDLGLVWLGTDKNNLPIGTITMEVDSISVSERTAIAKEIYISTTDARSGTSDVLNAKLYYRSSMRLGNVEIGGNYIKAVFGVVDMVEVGTSNVISANGSFTAMGK